MRQMHEPVIDEVGGVATLSRPGPRSVTVLRERWATTIVEAKLRPPALAAGHVARPALAAHLDGLTGRRLTLLTALAGFGKTSLLAEWIGGTARDAVAWVSLDAGDADPARLWSHVAEAVRRASGEACDAPREGGRARRGRRPAPQPALPAGSRHGDRPRRPPHGARRAARR